MKFMVKGLVVDTEAPVWLSIRAKDEDDVRWVLEEHYPGVVKVLKIVPFEEYESNNGSSTMMAHSWRKN